MQNIPILTLTAVATAAIAAHRFVTPGGAPAGADENTLGVSRSDAAIGDATPVDVLGTTIVEAGAAVTAGDTLKSDADGRAITWATSGAKLGLALGAAAAAGDFVEILLMPNVA